MSFPLKTQADIMSARTTMPLAKGRIQMHSSMRNYKAQAEFTTYSRGIAEDLNPNYCCHFETPYLMKIFGLS